MFSLHYSMYCLLFKLRVHTTFICQVMHANHLQSSNNTSKLNPVHLCKYILQNQSHPQPTCFLKYCSLSQGGESVGLDTFSRDRLQFCNKLHKNIITQSIHKSPLVQNCSQNICCAQSSICTASVAHTVGMGDWQRYCTSGCRTVSCESLYTFMFQPVPYCHCQRFTPFFPTVGSQVCVYCYIIID